MALKNKDTLSKIKEIPTPAIFEKKNIITAVNDGAGTAFVKGVLHVFMKRDTLYNLEFTKYLDSIKSVLYHTYRQPYLAGEKIPSQMCR